MAAVGKGIYLRGRTYWLNYQVKGERHYISLQTNDPVTAVKRAASARKSNEFAPKVGLPAEIDRCIETKKIRKEITSGETEKWMRRALQHLVTFLPGRTASTVTAADMERFLTALLKAQSESGAMSYMRAVSSFFSWTVKENIRFDNPCKGLVHEPDQPARKTVAAKEQRDAIMETLAIQRARCEGDDERLGPDPAADPYHEPIHFAVFCAFHAGLRFDEIVEARPDWFHLDAARPYIHVQFTPTFKPKNRKERNVPIAKPFLAFLRDYGLREPFMLMPDKAHGKAQYRYDFRVPWDILMAAHNMAGFTPHDGRRTFGSLLVIAGENGYKVANWLGHRMAVFEKHYGHLAPGDEGIDRTL